MLEWALHWCAFNHGTLRGMSSLATESLAFSKRYPMTTIMRSAECLNNHKRLAAVLLMREQQSLEKYHVFVQEGELLMA